MDLQWNIEQKGNATGFFCPCSSGKPTVAMIALQRMLLQYDGDEIYLLPAWPKDWDVEFKL